MKPKQVVLQEMVGPHKLEVFPEILVMLESLLLIKKLILSSHRWEAMPEARTKKELVALQEIRPQLAKEIIKGRFIHALPP